MQVLRWFENLKPKATGYTLRVLRGSAAVAYGIAAEQFLRDRGRMVVHHLYHSLRHAIRYASARESGRIPISNREVRSAAERLGADDSGRIFGVLADYRKVDEVPPINAEVLVEVVSELLENLLHLFFPPWHVTKHVLASLGTVTSIGCRLEDDRARFHAYIRTSDGRSAFISI